MDLGASGKPNVADHTKLREKAQALLHEPRDPGEIHVCPVCGGRAHFRFRTYLRRTKRMVGVHAWCESCHNEMAMDFLSPIPGWAQTESIEPSRTRGP